MRIRYRWPDIAAFLATCLIAAILPCIILHLATDY